MGSYTQHFVLILRRYRKCPTRRRKTERAKVLAQRKAGIDGDFLNPFTPSLPLIEGESEADYQSFRESCLRALKPKDALEVVWLQDFIDYTWEAGRLRRMKMAFIEAARKSAVRSLLSEFLDKGDQVVDSAWYQAKPLDNARMQAKPIAHGWSRGDEDAVATVEAILAEHGLDHDTITARAITANLSTFECLDKLIASYNYRRDASICELEKRRDHLAKRARDFGEAMITDVEPQDMEAVVSALPSSFAS